MGANRRVDEIRLFTLSFRALARRAARQGRRHLQTRDCRYVFGTRIQYEFSIPAGDANSSESSAPSDRLIIDWLPNLHDTETGPPAPSTPR